MKLSWSEKETFYHELGQYTKSGIALNEALESMLEEMPRGRVHRFTKHLYEQTQSAGTLAEVFAQEGKTLTELERTLMDAGAESGRLQESFAYLSTYFQALKNARRMITRRLLYPVFLLHFAPVLLNLPMLFGPNASVRNYVLETLGFILVLWVISLFLYFLISTFQNAAKNIGWVDRLLRLFPLMGKVHEWGALSRFCMSLQMQVQAGIPMLQALPVAGRTSQSGLVENLSKRAVKKIDEGASLSEALRDPNALTPALIRALRLGEDAGTVDEELRKWGHYYQEQSLNRLDLVAEWFPRVIYIGVLLLLGYKIVTTYQGMLQGMMEMYDF